MFERINPKVRLINELKKSQDLFLNLHETIGNNIDREAVKRAVTSIDELISQIEIMDIYELKQLLSNLYDSNLAYSNSSEILKKLPTFIDKNIIDEVISYSQNFINLEAIKIKNYFSIKNIEITNLKDKKEIYFVGENGDGKTILLQAILLALKKEYSGQVSEYIKDIQNDMSLSVKDEMDKDYSDNKNIKNIFAYGINRNKVDYKEYDSYGYGGLFDTSDSRKTTYLKDPFYELGKKYKGKSPLLQEFIKKLNSIILKENYKIFEDEVIDFNELSEGYKSTIIWLYDLVSRLIENQPEVKRISAFKAIVLIDEVDLYLHPKWKYDFVYNLRKVFPHIQFIMITHSTVTILGASEDAVFYKVYKEDGNTKVTHQVPNNKGYTNNTLISSPLFDLDTMTSRNYDIRKLSEDDYVYELIHEVVSKKIKEDVNLDEEAILKLIEEEFSKHEKN